MGLANSNSSMMPTKELYSAVEDAGISMTQTILKLTTDNGLHYFIDVLSSMILWNLSLLAVLYQPVPSNTFILILILVYHL